MEKLVAADIGTVERLGSMTPEQLEAIPEIDEGVVSHIQAAVVSFYGQYDAGESEEAPVNPEEIEDAIDASTAEDPNASPAAFDNIETGVLEQDLATHEAPQIEEHDGMQVLDLGRVEGLSAAPSTLHRMVGTASTEEGAESGTMEKPDSGDK